MYSSLFFSGTLTFIFVTWKVLYESKTEFQRHKNKMNCTKYRRYYRFIHSLVLDGIRGFLPIYFGGIRCGVAKVVVFVFLFRCSLFIFIGTNRSQTDWYVFRMVHACHRIFVVSQYTAVLFFCLHFSARVVCMPSYYMDDMLPIKLLVIYNNRLSLFSILLRPFGVVVGGGCCCFTLKCGSSLFIQMRSPPSSLPLLPIFKSEKKHAFLFCDHVFFTHKHLRRVTHTDRPTDRQKPNNSQMIYNSHENQNTLMCKKSTELHVCEPPSKLIDFDELTRCHFQW